MSRFVIGALRAGHYGATEQLAEALPAAGETVDILFDTSGAGPWFYAILDEPVKYRTAAGEDQDAAGPYTWVTDLVFRPHTVGEQPSFGMRAFAVDLAVVLDPYMRETAIVDLDHIDFIAVVEIDDADHEPPGAAEDQPDPPADVPIEPPAAFGPRAIGSQTALPEVPEADFPPEVAFPEPEFPAREVEIPELAEIPEPDFPSAPDDLIEDPFFPPPVPAAPARPPLLLPELADPEPARPNPSAATVTSQPEPAGARGRPSERAAQVDKVIAQAEAAAGTARPAQAPRKTSSPPTVDPTPTRDRKPLVAAGVATALLVLGGWGFSALQSRPGATDSTEGQADSTTSATSSESVTPSSRPPSPAPRPEDFAKVTRVLPPGYPPDSCRPATTVEDGGVATMACGRNDDLGGPPSGLYTVFPDSVALTGAFDRAVAASQQVNCPGNIQSPGPWRRNASPQQIAGTLFCGTRGQDPVIIWSDTERMLLSTVQGRPEGPTLDALYPWWTQHS